MGSTEIKVEPLIKSKERRVTKVKHASDSASEVVVHCCYKNGNYGGMIRIWKSTFLIDKTTAHSSKMLHHQNISLYPEWTFLEDNEQVTFTLVFSPLPKSCQYFDFLEKIPEQGGFEVRNIKRNRLDIYWLQL